MTSVNHMERWRLFAILDFLTAAFSLRFALFLRTKVFLPFFAGLLESPSFGFQSVLGPAIAFCFLYIVIQYFAGSYDVLVARSALDWLRKLFLPNLFLMAFCLSFLYIAQNFYTPRSFLITAVAINFFISFLWRMVYYKLAKTGDSKIVLFAQTPYFQSVLDIIEQDSLLHDIQVEAVFTKNEPIQLESNIPFKPWSAFKDFLQTNPIDAVIIIPSDTITTPAEVIDLVLTIPASIKIFLVPTLYEVFLGAKHTLRLSDLPLIRLPNFVAPWHYRAMKRALDIFAALLGLALAGIPMLFLALLIRLTSNGPIFFVQSRIGKGGRPFSIYKFRTMVFGAEKIYGEAQASKNDVRITKLGRFLRVTRLDELPQIFNILKGEMSIVGPRPLVPSEVSRFEESIPVFVERTRIRPGITGLAQVCGHYKTSADIKLKYDLAYIRRQSFLMDLEIILRTAKTVFTRAGL